MNRCIVVAAALLAGAAHAQYQPEPPAPTVYRWVDRDGSVHFSDVPPPPDVRQVEEKPLRGGSQIETSELPYAVRQAQLNFPVTLYTTPSCRSECQQARDLLTRRGVPFAEIVVEDDEQYQRFKQTFPGQSGYFPAVLIGSQKYTGFNEAAWGDTLDDAGYPRSAVPGRKPQPQPARPAPRPEQAAGNGEGGPSADPIRAGQ